jgi:hypothetical protein
MTSEIKNILKGFNLWAYNLSVAAIGGGATSASSWLGVAAANQLGMNVPPLDWQTLLIVFASGAMSSVFFYLKQSPLPPLEDDEEEDAKTEKPPETPKEKKM